MKQIHCILSVLGMILLTACDHSLPETAATGEGRAIIGRLTAVTADTLAVTTRAEEDFEDFIAVVQRVETDGAAEVRRYAGTDIATQLQGHTLTLTPGDYRLQLYNTHYDPAAAGQLVETPTYYGEQTFTIQAGQTTEVAPVVSRQTHIGITVIFSAEVQTCFTGTLTLTDALSALTWTATLPGEERQTVYFPATAALTYTLSLTNTDDESFSHTSPRLQEHDTRNFEIHVVMEE